MSRSAPLVATFATVLLAAGFFGAAAAQGPAPVFTITVTGVGPVELTRTGGGQCRGQMSPAQVDVTVTGGFAGNQVTGEIRCFGVIASCTATQIAVVSTCTGAGVQPGAPFGCTWKYTPGPVALPPSAWTVECKLF